MAFSDHEISIIKGMIIRGDTQSHIAAYFGNANGGRISEINTGKKGVGIPAAPVGELPPPGPYFTSGRASIRAKETLRALRELIDGALADIESFETAAKDAD